MESKFTKVGFVRSYVVPALLLFAIPVAGLAFARHAIGTYDARFRVQVADALDKDPDLSATRRGEILAFYGKNAPSALCAAGPDGRAALPPSYAEEVCGDFQQLGWILIASRISLLFGVLSLIVVLACVGLSFASRTAQYLSFLAGWNFMRVASALQVIAQGFIAVMLSFWLTAFFFNMYALKLILVTGVLALGAVGLLLVAIFRKPGDTLEVQGALLSRETSKDLWTRIEGLCARLGTPPPDQIVGGIDDNFFVTEHPVHLGPKVLEGRTLFVSLSLLKRLHKAEADAILAHEMAHFSGGDTLSSKKISPLLSRYRAYMVATYQGGLSRPVFYFMLFYWSLFQLSLGRASRQRELRADKIAADSTTPQHMANALFKVAAYSSYRARVEAGLFDRNRAHSELNIAHSVAVGFTEYAQGARLQSDLEGESFPHPFDSHPSLAARLSALGLSVPAEDISQIVVATSGETWFSEIDGADEIEQSLWQAYEARFRAIHEESLAYRYLPATEEERAHVERFFPKIEFVGKSAEVVLRLDCDKLCFAEWSGEVSWSAITKVEAKDEAFGGKVLVFHVQQIMDTGKLKLPLKRVSAPGEEVTTAIGRYYGRFLAAKAHLADVPAPPRAQS